MEYVFNPRLREGGDVFHYCWYLLIYFSIHASAKEATYDTLMAVVDARVFNPRLREGGDDNVYADNAKLSVFQSTPPRRRRLYYLFRISHFLSFQSTPPRRRRLFHPPKLYSFRFFQSTPPRRRRQHTHFYMLKLYGFQSTPPRRRRPHFQR